MRTAGMGAVVMLGSVLLSGCSDSDVKEVNQWMDEVKRETKVAVVPLSEPKTFIPFAYSARDENDPYNPNKLLGELARAAEVSNNPLRPDEKRRKEPLESYPLDTMRMVGSMQSKGITYALVQIERALHHIKLGDRLGQNHGKVVSVNDAAIGIKEVVQDAAGEWVERMSKLELQESKETKK